MLVIRVPFVDLPYVVITRYVITVWDRQANPHTLKIKRR